VATQQDLIDGMERWLPDDIDVPDTTQRRDAAITSALRRFGRDVPRRSAQEVTANPVATAGLTDGWDNEFSELISVEWPYLTETAGILSKSLQAMPDGSPRATIDVEADGTYAIRFPGFPVAVGSSAFITYTLAWTAASLPTVWEEAVTVKASALLCHQLAGLYDGTEMPEPSGIALINAGERADSFREHAKVLDELYRDLVGQAPSQMPPASKRKHAQFKESTA